MLASAAPAAVAAAAPAGAAAAAPGAAGDPVDVHVQLLPGRQRHIKGAAKDKMGNAMNVKVAVTVKKGSSTDLAAVEGVIKAAKDDQFFREEVEEQLTLSVGLRPTILKVENQQAQITQWSKGVCEKHVATVVKRFTLAYTRRNVPAALYNECTNFMPQASFSDDGVLNKVDAQKCRAATFEFSQKWNFGKGNGPAAAAPAPAAAAAAPAAPAATGPVDYSAFCTTVCEMKFGEGAPQCHVESGEKRAGL